MSEGNVAVGNTQVGAWGERSARIRNLVYWLFCGSSIAWLC